MQKLRCLANWENCQLTFSGKKVTFLLKIPATESHNPDVTGPEPNHLGLSLALSTAIPTSPQDLTWVLGQHGKVWTRVYRKSHATLNTPHGWPKCNNHRELEWCRSRANQFEPPHCQLFTVHLCLCPIIPVTTKDTFEMYRPIDYTNSKAENIIQYHLMPGTETFYNPFPWYLYHVLWWVGGCGRWVCGGEGGKRGLSACVYRNT